MRVITWDVEIAQEVDSHPRGWDAARNGQLGISSVALYDTATGRFHLYDEHTLEACSKHLNEADVLVGFNSIDFDTPCFEGASGTDITVQQYDILQEVWGVLGNRRFKGYGLDPICQRTLGLSKSGSGERAPALYKQGRFAELFDYNIHDVHLTRLLLNHIEEHGYIINIDHEPLEIECPGFTA